MMKYPGYFASVLLIAACCAQQPGERAFLAAVDAFYAAVNTGDQAAHAALFTDAAWMLSNGGQISRGDHLKTAIREQTGWVFLLKDVERLEYGISGNLAYTINQYYYTWHAEGAQPEWHKTKNVHIWQRQADGVWRLHVDIWNATPE